jgi:hypothetical protein
MLSFTQFNNFIHGAQDRTGAREACGELNLKSSAWQNAVKPVGYGQSGDGMPIT